MDLFSFTSHKAENRLSIGGQEAENWNCAENS